MAGVAGSFVDALVVIYDKDYNYVTKTVVTGHDRKAMHIEIASVDEELRVGMRLYLLIIHGEGASEFRGVVRTVSFSMSEISLFAEKPRAGRGAVRHTLNVPASVSKLIIDREEHKPNEPMQVTIENLSSTGALVKSPVLYFEAGTILQIDFSIHDREATINARVVREQINSDNSYSFGCQLMFLQ